MVSVVTLLHPSCTCRQRKGRCASGSREEGGGTQHRENVTYSTPDDDEAVFKKPKIQVRGNLAVCGVKVHARSIISMYQRK